MAQALLVEMTRAVSVCRLCPRCGSSDHGRPLARVVDGSPLWVSIAYADGLVAVAWSEIGPVGVDVEREGPGVDGIDRRTWTEREALFKAGASDLPVRALPDLPAGHVGTVVGDGVHTRLARSAADCGERRWSPS